MIPTYDKPQLADPHYNRNENDVKVDTAYADSRIKITEIEARKDNWQNTYIICHTIWAIVIITCVTVIVAHMK